MQASAPTLIVTGFLVAFDDLRTPILGGTHP
jgi:hypothetical protein